MPARRRHGDGGLALRPMCARAVTRKRTPTPLRDKIMKSKRTLNIARYLGVGAAMLVPALVVAQQQTSPPTSRFGEGDLLRASEVRQLRDALNEAILRINTLEAGSGG